MKRFKNWLRATALVAVVMAVMGFFLLSNVALKSMEGVVQTQVSALDIFNVLEAETADGWHTLYSEQVCYKKEDGGFYHRVDIDAVWYDDSGKAYPAVIDNKVNVDEAVWGSESEVRWSALAKWDTGESYPMSGTLVRPPECYPPTPTSTIVPTVTATMTLTLVPTVTPTASPTETSIPTSTATPTVELTPTSGITPVLGTPVAQTATPTLVPSATVTPTPFVTPITPTATVTPTVPVVTVTPITPPMEEVPPTPTSTQVLTNTTSLPETGVDELGIKPRGNVVGLVVIRDSENKVVRVDKIFSATYTRNLETGKYEVVIPESGFVYDRGHLEIHLMTPNGFLAFHSGYTVEITLFNEVKVYSVESTFKVPNEEKENWNFAPNNSGIPDIVTCYWTAGENEPDGNQFYILKEVK